MVRRHVLALIVFCAVIWLPGLPMRTLWATDESRYALLARDMDERGDYVVPLLRGGEIYHQQPPLFLWSEVVSRRLVPGIPAEAAYRLPSFVAGTGGVLVVYGLAATLFGPAAGLASGLVLATDLRYLQQAEWISTDMVLCFFMTAVLACFYRAYDSGRRRWYLAMYAMAGLGTLTKGPVGFVLPGMVIVAYLVARRDWAEIPRMRLHWGVLIVAAILAPWILLFWHQAGAEQVTNLILKQSFERYTHAWNNLAPWYYFLWRFPLDFLPWIVILPFAVTASWRGMEPKHRAFLWTWFAVIFLFFSVSTGKRGVYLLPLHPAAAMLTGWYWGTASRWLDRSSRAVGLLFLALGAALLAPIAPARVAAMPGLGPALTAVGAVSLLCGLAIVVVRRSHRLPVIAGATGLVMLVGVLLLAPLENRRQNITAFSAEIARLVPEGARVGMVRNTLEDFAYYSHREPEVELRPGRRLKEWMQQPDRVYAVLDQEAYEDLERHSWSPHSVLSRNIVIGQPYYLIAKEPHGNHP